VFNKICVKVIDLGTMQVLKEDAIEIVMFPLANFDVMTRLVVHLIKELDICGPIYTKWMHPIERYMKVL
jgi:hypothetical protein